MLHHYRALCIYIYIYIYIKIHGTAWHQITHLKHQQNIFNLTVIVCIVGGPSCNIGKQKQCILNIVLQCSLIQQLLALSMGGNALLMTHTYVECLRHDAAEAHTTFTLDLASSTVFATSF